MFVLTRKMQPVKIQLAWEVLPATDGRLHAVNPDPRAFIHDDFPTSLCGVMLVAQGGKVSDSETCAACLEESRIRQAEFDGSES